MARLREKKCPQCAETIKAEARVCRFCGHQFPEQEVEQQDAASRFGNRARFGCLAVVAVLMIAMIASHKVAPMGNGAVEASGPVANETAPDPHKAARDLQEKTAFAAGSALKAASRNPDSLVIESGLASADGQLLCVRYRAQNGFGGMNREAVAFYKGRTHESAAFWNAHCAHRVLDDLTENVKLGARFSS
jgi:hypothetical protein